jgi:hypothetical protein
LQSTLLLAELADFAEQHADFGGKGLAELVEVLKRTDQPSPLALMQIGLPLGR